MASPEKIQSFLGFLATNYSSFDPRDDALVSYWTLMLKNLSEKQMDTGVERMAHEHNSAWPPKPAMFNSWAGGREYVRKGSEIHFKQSWVKVRGQLQEHALIVQGEAPQHHSPHVPREESLRRFEQLLKVVDGKIKLPGTPEEYLTIIQCDDPLNPEALALGNHNRNALGWPLLNSQGRPVPHA